MPWSDSPRMNRQVNLGKFYPGLPPPPSRQPNPRKLFQLQLEYRHILPLEKNAQFPREVEARQ